MADESFRIDFEDLSQQVYRTLKRMILIGELKTGQKLRQDELAERLGVSRTPLLSAFSKLEKEMLVEQLPRRGARVRKYEPAEMIDVYEIRLRLEPFGASGAAENATDQQISELLDRQARFRELAAGEDPMIKELDYDIHMYIMELSGNHLLYNIISSYNLMAVANFYGFFKAPSVSAAEHDRLCAAIAARDSRRALAEMYQHIASSLKHLRAHVNELSSKTDSE